MLLCHHSVTILATGGTTTGPAIPGGIYVLSGGGDTTFQMGTDTLAGSLKAGEYISVYAQNTNAANLITFTFKIACNGQLKQPPTAILSKYDDTGFFANKVYLCQVVGGDTSVTMIWSAIAA